MAVDAARSRAGTLTSVAHPPAAERAEDLYGRYRERIYGYCLYQLGRPEEAEDVLQTTFLYAFRALRRGVVPVAEGPWLFTIAKNACLERRRSARRRGAEILSDPQVLESSTAAAERNDEDGLRLQEALQRVPEQQRNAFVLREWRGLSYREIAAQLGVSIACVETLIFRARRTLAELLAEGDEPRGRRKGIARALDLGSLGAALKSLLAGGTAAKVAAAAALATGVVVTGGSSATAPASKTHARAAAAVVPVLATELAEQAALRSLETGGGTATSAAPRDEARPGKEPEAAPQQGGPAGAPAVDPPAQAPVGELIEKIDGTGGTGEVGVDLGEPLQTPDVPLPVEAPSLPEAPALPAAPELPSAPDLGSALPSLP